MTDRKNIFRYNMNLAKSYVEDWGLFEGLREFYANFVDACPDFLIEFDGPDNAILTSDTIPSLDQMFLLGEGTKTDDGSTIGQFGEGAKLAALCLTRRRNSSVVMTGPMGQVTFEFRCAVGINTPTLHAVVDPKLKQSGCFVVQLEGKDLLGIYKERFLARDAETGPFAKEPKSQGMRVFCKGILIKRVEETSLYDWNLDNVTLNRDRSVPDAWSLQNKIGQSVSVLCRTDEAWADRMLCNTESYEARALCRIYNSDATKQALTAAAKRRFGDRAVLASSDSHINTIAEYKGNRPIIMGDLGAELLLPKATDVVVKADRLTESAATLPPHVSVELSRLMDMLRIKCEIHVSVDDGKTLGSAHRNDDGRVVLWLNERLLMAGFRHERLRTVLHELGHLKGGGGDASVEFEADLDWIAATLAEKLLDQGANGI